MPRALKKAKNENKTKTDFDNAEGGILITDKNATVLYANKGMTDRTGFAAAEVIGKKPSDLWGGHMAKPFYERMWQLITHQQPFVGEVENKTKAGKRYLESLHIAPILDRAGNLKYFIEIAPSHKTSGDRHNASRDFVQEFNRQKNHDGSVIRFLFQTLNIPPPRATDDTHLASFVEQMLVEPTQALYKDRSEDRSLIINAQKDSAAFGQLYEKYAPKIKRQLLLRLHDEALADDLTQETFLRAFKSLPRFTVSNASYLTYLQHIAHNLLVSHYRATKPTVSDEALLANLPTQPVDYANLWDIEALWRVVQTLPPIDQTVLRLKYLDGLPVRDIADKLHKTENAVKLILSRARKKLQSGMNTQTVS